MMKRYAGLWLAVGLGVLTASAQSVTVVLKDGTMKRFGAEYISKMQFEEATNVGDVVQVDRVSMNVYSEGNVVMTLKGADVTLELDMYMPKVGYLPAGDYAVTSGNGAYTIDPNPQYTYVNVGGVKRTISSGHMTVAESNGVDYTFNAAFTLDDGTELKAEYQGQLPRYSRQLQVTFASAAYGNTESASDIKVNFAFYSKTWDCETGLTFRIGEEVEELPDGTYMYSAGTAAETFGGDSNVHVFKPEHNYSISGGAVVVSTLDNGDRQVEMDLTLGDGRPARLTYTGTIGGTPSHNVRAAAMMKAPAM